jgi:hypothetical protein
MVMLWLLLWPSLSLNYGAGRKHGWDQGERDGNAERKGNGGWKKRK